MQRNLELSGLGKFDFNTKLDLGRRGIEAGIAGGGFQIGGGIAQPAHRGNIEVAGEQPDLEFVEHVECAPAPRDRTLAALGWILDALHGKQRIDVAGGLRRCGGERGSSGAAGVSGNEKPVELVRRVLLAGDPSVVPFGP